MASISLTLGKTQMMQVVRPLSFRYLLHTCACLDKQARGGGGKGAQLETFRSARMIKKLMTGSNRSRRKFFTVNQPVSKSFSDLGTTVAGAGAAPRKSNKCLRRVEVLSVLFMEQITSLLSTGEIDPEILGLGLTISYVKVSSDFSKVNVFWAASGTEKDDNVIVPILRRAAGKLRHQLSQLRVIGIVPPIEFVKDKTFSKIGEVEHLLSKCDFGDDFIPTSNDKLFSQIANGEGGVEEEGEGETLTTTLNEPSTEKELYSSITMRQDMLGVPHDLVMSQIKELVTRVKKNKNPSSLSNLEPEPEEAARLYDPDDADCTPSTENQRSIREDAIALRKRHAAFFKYIKSKKFEKEKELKRLSTAAKDQEFLDEEAFDRWEKFVASSLPPEIEDFQEDKEDFDQTFYSSHNDYR